MTIHYVYTLDPPLQSPPDNRRQGYRTPRSILLPPYLAMNQYFVDYVDAIDEVFEQMVDQKTEIIGGMRNMWTTNPPMENNYVQEAQLIPFEGWSQPEREILVKQVNMLGMKLQSAGLISNDSYQTISRWVGEYWFGKGTQSFIDFINYCLSSSLKVQKLWTQDYVNFVPEGDASIGTPIWDGGTWYPTTHVSIVASGGLQQIDPASLINFFYEIANYNLVLQSIEIAYDMWITDDATLKRTDAEIVAIGLWANSSIVMSNLYSYGVASPPIFDLAPAIPANMYVASQPSSMAGLYLLSAPTAWILIDGKKFPAYTPVAQTPTVGGGLTTTMCGGPSTNGSISGYALIAGPVNWAKVPGSSRSTARIPTFTHTPVLKTTLPGMIPSRIVGNQRAYLLCNPAGWMDVTGTGQVTPYWI